MMVDMRKIGFMVKIYSNQKGFTFMELIFVMLVISILLSAFLPTFIKTQVDSQLADKEVASIKMRVEAIRWYFYNKKTPPPNWNTLKTEGYLPTNLPDSGIFGTYNLEATTNPSWISQISVNNVRDTNILRTVLNTIGNAQYDTASQKLTIGVVKPGQEVALQSVNDRITQLEDKINHLKVARLIGIYRAGTGIPFPTDCPPGQQPRIYVAPVAFRAGTSGYSLVGAITYADVVGNGWVLRALVKGSDGVLYSDSDAAWVLAMTFCE